MKNKIFYNLNKLQISFLNNLTFNQQGAAQIKIVDPETNTVLLEKDNCNQIAELLLWLEKEVEVVLSEAEKTILANYKGQEKWLFRDNDNKLYMIDKTNKAKTASVEEENDIGGGILEFPFPDLFKFIRVGDEPININELLKANKR